ncbi:MAG: hypothetical protein M1827_005405 [Pycnora praestabilis]|nr:MAG: hypothetical protein M1827_005405 [Pycnora praestabilis]
MFNKNDLLPRYLPLLHLRALTTVVNQCQGSLHDGLKATLKHQPSSAPRTNSPLHIARGPDHWLSSAYNWDIAILGPDTNDPEFQKVGSKKSVRRRPFSMLLPKGGVTWKSTKARMPPTRAVFHFLTRTRFLLFITIAGMIILLWRGISKSASDMQSFYCWGPAKPPMEMTVNEQSAWNAHLQTPIIFNHHAPLEIDSPTISKVDLNPIKSTTKSIINEERVLILTPLRDAAPYINKYFDLLSELSYPHELIDLAFLVGDSTDDTLAVLAAELDRVQKRSDKIPFRTALIVEKDFGAVTGQTVEERHGFAAQGPRRKAMGRARNYLLSAALKAEHSWVFWRDVDIVDSPRKILEDFMAHDKDVIVPSTSVPDLGANLAELTRNVDIWFHRYANGRDIEGKCYKEFETGRTYLVKLGDWRNNKDDEVELDGIGGVEILVKADVHRSGINFPCYAFENQAETEGFAKMAKRAGYQVVGLPNYVVWHIDTEEKPGNLGKRPA